MEANTTVWYQDSQIMHNSRVAPNDTHSVNNSSGDTNRFDPVIVQVDFWLAIVTTFSLASLGIIGNLFALVVWHTDKEFNATAFLFKYLAVWDIVYLGSIIGYNCIIRMSWLATNEALKLGVYHGSNFVQLVSVHVTLLISISRWIAVTYPLQAVRRLTVKRIYLTSVLILLYCLVLEAAQALFNAFYKDSTILFIIKRILGLALPFLLLLIFNLSLLWTASRHRKELHEIEMRGTSRDQTNSTGQRSSQSSDTVSVSLETKVLETTTVSEESKCMPPKTDQKRSPDQQKPLQPEKQQENSNGKNRLHHHHHQSQRQQSRKQMMVKAVLLVSLCSFIAYPIGTIVRICALERDELSLLTKYIVLHVTHICEVINSSINVFIYWFFVSKFKQLANRFWRHLYARLRCRKAN